MFITQTFSHMWIQSVKKHGKAPQNSYSHSPSRSSEKKQIKSHSHLPHSLPQQNFLG